MLRKISPPLSLLVLTLIPNLPLLASMSAGAAPGADDGSPCYDDAVAAVVAALNAHNPASIREDREYLGAVLRQGDGYTWVAAAGIAGRDRISVRLSVPAGAQVVAFWHTHGAAADRHRYFSDTDTELVRHWQVPFYLGDHTGKLKVFAPGDRKLSLMRARKLGLPRRRGFARGAVVNDRCGVPVVIATRAPPTFARATLARTTLAGATLARATEARDGQRLRVADATSRLR